MRPRPGPLSRTTVAAIAAVWLAFAADARRVGDPAAGKLIYTGQAAAHDSTITASIGGDEVPAALVPCLNCHGADGRGRAEGGVVPSDLNWLELTKPYRTETLNGRRRPPYTEESLARAITTGVDSGGNSLNSAMPRYSMSAGEVSDLVAYLKVVGREDTAGITDDTIRIATLVPASGPGATIGSQIAAVLAGSLAEGGEIHGRRAELEVIRVPADGTGVAQALERAIAAKTPFAFAGGLITGVDDSVADVLERAGIPLVLPVGGNSGAATANRQRFDFYPTLETQLETLLRFAATQNGRAARRVAVLARDDESAAIGRRAAEALPDAEVLVVDTSTDGGGEQVARAVGSADVVLFLDPQLDLRKIPSGAGAGTLLFHGSLLPRSFFDFAGSFAERAFVAFPSAPEHIRPAAMVEYRAFAERHSIDGEHVAAQIAAYTSARVLIHTLKKSGRELTREGLRTALESLYRFDTGLTPPLTYGRSRRSGSTTTYISRLDPSTRRLRPVAQIETDQGPPP